MVTLRVAAIGKIFVISLMPPIFATLCCTVVTPRRAHDDGARDDRSLPSRRAPKNPSGCQSCLVHLGRHILLLFDRAELREQGKKIGQITGFRDLSVTEPIKADSANHCLLLCR